MTAPCSSDVRLNFSVDMREAILNRVYKDPDVARSELQTVFDHQIYTKALELSGFDERIVKNQESYSMSESFENAGVYDLQCRIQVNVSRETPEDA